MEKGIVLQENTINYYTANQLNLKSIINAIDFDNIDEAVHICDLTKLEEKYINWQKYMPNIKPYYAVKCNDDQYILQILAKLDCNFDCASKMEIKQILELNVKPERIIFANPCKPIAHIKYAQENNVQLSTVDNEFEIYKLYQYYPKSSLVIRFRSEAKSAQCPLGDKFGCDAENEACDLMLLAKSLNLNVIGVSFHVGSGCTDFPAYDRAIITAKNLFEFGQLLGFNMHLLDIGGGFPGSDDDKFQNVAQIINQSLMHNFPERNQLKVIAEPGRYFVAAAYTLICKIHAKREIRSPQTNKLITKMYYLNDGIYGSFNCILYDHQQVIVQHFINDGNKVNSDVSDVSAVSGGGTPENNAMKSNLMKFKSLIWGPTCDALDKIIDNIDLPDLCCGDLLAFPNMGAYTIPVASPFNGFMLPKIFYFLNEKYK